MPGVGGVPGVHGVPGVRSTALELPPHQPTSTWKAGGEHGTQSQEGARCSPEPSLLVTAACVAVSTGARRAVREGRPELCWVMQEGETVLAPVA